MGVVTTILDILGGLILALGGVSLLNELYATLAWRKVPGRILAWEPVSTSDGKTVIGYKARVSFSADGVVTESESRGTSQEAATKTYPVGAGVPLRYPARRGEMPEIREGAMARFAFPVGAMVVGAALFVVSTFIR